LIVGLLLQTYINSRLIDRRRLVRYANILQPERYTK